jgi:hypothetical protein
MQKSCGPEIGGLHRIRAVWPAGGGRFLKAAFRERRFPNFGVYGRGLRNAGE